MTAYADRESAIYIGCMSGTSLDGLDCVAARFDDHGPAIEQLADSHTPYPKALAETLRRAALQPTDIDEVCRLDAELGLFYADAIINFIEQSELTTGGIAAIGSHGQTLRHAPDADPPWTLQIGDASRIAARCGLPVVSDFRRKDMALGGQGAPLTPAFHAWAFRRPGIGRAILNIGGISNLTLLPADPQQPVTGFDCGPGNCLIDHLARQDFGQDFDSDGRIAAQGQIAIERVRQILEREPYFRRKPPKSTGTDHFSPAWLEAGALADLPPSDRIASVTELTALGIVHSLRHDSNRIDELYVCGGGARNRFLMQRLRGHLPAIRVEDSSALGMDPQQVEALAFAWLARQTLLGRPGNLPSVTHARSATVLGCVHFAHEKPGSVC